MRQFRDTHDHRRAILPRARSRITRLFKSGTAGLILAAAALLAAPAADAMDARVLPKGRFRFSFIHGKSGGISDMFNGAGAVEPIVAPYELELTGKNFKDVLPEVQTLVDYLNSFGNYRYDIRQRTDDNRGVVQSSDPALPTLGDAVARGILDLEAEARRSQYNFALMYGLSDTTSFGVIVPYISQSIDVEAGIAGANTADDIYHGFTPVQGASPEVQEGLEMARNLDTEFLQKLLVDGGYGRAEDVSDSGLGDIVVGGRHLYLDGKHKTGHWLGSTQMGVTLPTGKTYPPSELLSQDLGDGAWALNAANVVNFNPNPTITIAQTTNYTYRLPGSRIYRVPAIGDASPIPDASTEMTVDEQLGYKFWLTLGAKIKPTYYLTLNANYEWYWKGRDHYSGTDPSRDYAWLSDKTNRYLETLQLGVSLSSIQAFMKGKFPIPADLSFDVYIPVKGRNNPVATFGVTELNFYF